MIDQRFMYAAEKFAAARRMLMAPHPNGESESFAAAFQECFLGLEHVVIDELNDYDRDLVGVVRQTIDTTGLEDRYNQGLWRVKAGKIRTVKRQRFADAVSELADSFQARFRGMK